MNLERLMDPNMLGITANGSFFQLPLKNDQICIRYSIGKLSIWGDSAEADSTEADSAEADIKARDDEIKGYKTLFYSK